jgi:hypothetical protein
MFAQIAAPPNMSSDLRPIPVAGDGTIVFVARSILMRRGRASCLVGTPGLARGAREVERLVLPLPQVQGGAR